MIYQSPAKSHWSSSGKTTTWSKPLALSHRDDAMPPPKSQTKKPEALPTLASVFAPPTRKVTKEESREDAVRQAVQQACLKALDEDAIDYLANMAVSVVEDFNDAESLRRELEEGFLPMLEEYEVSTEDAQALCAKVLEVAAPMEAPIDDLGAVDEKFLCYIPNLLLMYGGSPEPLLRGACLEIRRGHRYGVVGSNGSGKTTLMARIASKDISGLPDDLRVVLLRHEAILQGVRRSTKVRDYVSDRNIGEDAASPEEMEKALQIMGFDTEEQMGKAVLELSGGWQMRLALACAVARKANLLLLDEPTNHLDAEGVRWLVEFINTTCGDGDGQGAAMIVSHDPDFLDLVCTDVVHFSPSSQKGKLAYYPGIFSAFKAQQLNGDEAEAKRLLETQETKEISLGLGPDDGNRMAFPIPEKIGDTTAERKAAVVTLSKAAFQYKGAQEPVFQEISVELSMSSRVGIVGKNGSGKSTLLSMLAGRKQPSSIGGKTGRLWWHKDLRLAYIAQHALAHLGNYVDKTPLEYMQIRFRRGFDEETPIVRSEKLLSAKEEEEMQRVGVRHGKRGKAVEALVNRIEITDSKDKAKEKDREFLYEVKWKDLSPAENSFESISRLKQLKALKLVEDLNSRIWAAWAGCPQRPLTDREVFQHMEPFGLDEDVLCHRRISVLSSGQKCKLALGAAFWTRPHVVCLDEPTNYLDTDTVELLKRAMRAFRGGFAVVSHNEKLIEEVCDEVWTMEDGNLTAERRSRK